MTPAFENGFLRDSNGDLVVTSDTSKTILFGSINVAASGDNTVVTAVASKKIVVIAYTVVADGAVAATWKDGAATALSGAMSFAANGGIAARGEILTPLLQTSAGNALILNLGSAVGVRGHLTYYTV